MLEDERYEVTGIFTSINDEFDRVSMHSVRLSLLKLQANRLNLPLKLIRLPFPCSNEIYEERMQGFIEEAKANDIECFGFGDLFLQDIRNYRVKQLAGTGIYPVFPIWGEDTLSLSVDMVEQGVRSVVTCIDENHLTREYCGTYYDKEFLHRLPSGIDPCGENGEFHSFVFDCPLFANEIPIQLGKQVSRDGFTYQDLYF